MVPAAFPVAKLGALLLKQISKPIANAVKEQAKSSPVFRRYVCLPPARFYNWCEIKLKMWLLHFGQPVNIAVLSEEMAIDLGANLLGEGVIFIIAAGILVSEYTRSSRKEAAKEEAKQQEMSELKRTLAELYMQVEEQGATIRQLSRLLGDLETRGLMKHAGHHHHHEDPKPPPPPQSSPIQPISVDRSEIVQNGVVFKAIRNFENLFLKPPKEQDESILILALNHLYENVYRVPLRF